MLDLETPFTMMIAGPSGCGKTSFVLKLLPFVRGVNKILWCNAERNAIPSNNFNCDCDVQVMETVPTNFDNVDNTLIVLDDLMTDAYTKNVCELFTKGSHHRHISVILITQNIFHQGKFCRDISLNCKYLVVFNNPRDKSQIYPLARQIFPDNAKEFVRVYKEVASQPYGYLLMDLTQACSEIFRFRTDIFNSLYETCYVPSHLISHLERYEAIEGTQTYVTCLKKL